MKIGLSFLFCIIAVSFSINSLAFAVTLAKTFSFNEDITSKLPTEATTDFFCGWDTTNPLAVAEHELFHAIGFTSAYTKFNASLKWVDATYSVVPFVARKFDNDGNTIAYVNVDMLNESNISTGHLSRTGSVSTFPTISTNLATDLMGPDIVQGIQPPSILDKMILDILFNWSEIGIRINVDFQEPFYNKEPINQSVQVITSLFDGSRPPNPHEITWHVRFIVSEPATLELFTFSLVFIIVKFWLRQRSLH